MPKLCQALIHESSSSIGCPPDFVGVSMLPVLGAAIGNSRVLEVKAGYEESATVYAMNIAEPGEKKTPAARIAIAPAVRAQVSLRRDYRRMADEYTAEMRRYEVKKREAAKNDLPAGPPPEEPHLERTLVEDTTVEALAVLLERNLRGVSVWSDELSAFFLRMNQYKRGQGADRPFWLSAWSNSYVSVDRKNRSEPLMIQRPFVTVFGSIQPEVLRELAAGRDDGLLDRFLMSRPDPIRGRWSESEISAHFAENTCSVIRGRPRETGLTRQTGSRRDRDYSAARYSSVPSPTSLPAGPARARPNPRGTPEKRPLFPPRCFNSPYIPASRRWCTAWCTEPLNHLTRCGNSGLFGLPMRNVEG